MEKIVHQSWKNTELKPEHVPCVETMKKFFPDYEYRFWTDEDNDKLIQEQFPEFYNYYITLKPIDKADFVRFLYVYTQGGVYADVDISMLKPITFDDDHDVFLCDQMAENSFLGTGMDPFFFAGKKGCQFFYSICEAMQRGTIYKLLSPEITETTPMGPLYKTANIFLAKFYLLNKQKYKIKILDEFFANDYTYRDAEDKSKYYGIHHQSHTWMTWIS